MDLYSACRPAIQLAFLNCKCPFKVGKLELIVAVFCEFATVGVVEFVVNSLSL